MTYAELSEYIERYLKHDKTNRSIMLTGAWGSGKSFYIKNDLLKHLGEKNIDCVIVSLYGITEISEISKSIYMELRTIKLFESNEVTKTIKVAGKTILKNVTQLVPALNFNTNIDKNDLQSLYESIDLSGKLIIFEDMERSHINIIEFLGYVNNFTEQDCAKVLLVANEEEIVEVESYKKVKEKTISDTICFDCDYPKAISSIITIFEGENLNEFIGNDDIIELSEIVKGNTGNLRSFIFACQKANDIFDKCVDISPEIKKCIFLGILHYSLKHRSDMETVWKENDGLSFKLGDNKYPLFYSCYEYIQNYVFDATKLNNDIKDYYAFKEAVERQKSDKDLKDLYNYYLFCESELLKIVEKIKLKLTQNEIDLMSYGKLAYTLVEVGNILKIDIENSKVNLIKNLKGKEFEIDKDKLFIYDKMIDDKKDFSDGYILLKQEMLNSLTDTGGNWFGFEYNPNHVSEFYNKILESQGLILNSKSFLRDINIDKFVSMIKNCNPSQLHDIRCVFLAVYRSNNISDYLKDDKEKLVEILSRVSELNKETAIDKVVKLHLSYFEDNLQEILENFD